MEKQEIMELIKYTENMNKKLEEIRKNIVDAEYMKKKAEEIKEDGDNLNNSLTAWRYQDLLLNKVLDELNSITSHIQDNLYYVKVVLEDIENDIKILELDE
jgi:DNA repair ATPase RecN